jgi:dihydrofolate reductase
VSSPIRIVIVAAVARNNVIGGGNALLWRLSSDLKRFRQITWGKPLLMGRKTFESIGKPLPGRETIVVTRDPSFHPEGVHVAHSLDAAMDLAAVRAREMNAAEVVIAGGGDIYAQAMLLADRLELTHVDLSPDGDAFFPQVDPSEWSVVSRVAQPAGQGDEAAHTFCVYERRRKGSAGVEKVREGA